MITENKRKTLEVLQSMIESGELGIYEFENIEGKDCVEELRQLFQFSDVSLTDTILKQRVKPSNIYE